LTYQKFDDDDDLNDDDFYLYGSQLAGLVYKVCRVMHMQKLQNKNKNNTTKKV